MPKRLALGCVNSLDVGLRNLQVGLYRNLGYVNSAYHPRRMITQLMAPNFDYPCTKRLIQRSLQPTSIPAYDGCGITGAEGFVRSPSTSFDNNAAVSEEDNDIAVTAAVKRKRRKKKPTTRLSKRSSDDDDDSR